MAFPEAGLTPETHEAAPAIPDGGTEAGPAPETQETAPAIPDGGTEAGLARADADEPGPGVERLLSHLKTLVKEGNPETDTARETQDPAIPASGT